MYAPVELVQVPGDGVERVQLDALERKALREGFYERFNGYFRVYYSLSTKLMSLVKVVVPRRTNPLLPAGKYTHQRNCLRNGGKAESASARNNQREKP